MIEFALWSPDEDTFWQSWVGAGICAAPHEFTAEYPGVTISDQTSQGWVPVDADGVVVPGWHANVRIADPGLTAQFTYGLPQTNANGELLPLFARTWAAEVFSLTEQAADPVTGFPAGMRNQQGVTYTDMTDISTPTNVIA